MSTFGKIGWRTYFFFSIAIAVALLWLDIGDPRTPSFSGVLDHLFGFIALLGVFGYAFQVRVFKQRLWKLYLPFFAIWELSFGIYDIGNIIAENPQDDWWLVAIALALVGLFVLIKYVALYLYGYRSIYLWNSHK